METGRPALVVPHGGAPRTPFDRVMVAWNASREASRAVHDALPLLVAAKEVVILVIDPDDIGAALGRQPGSGVARHLEHHGASVRVKTVESGRRRAGEVILSEATARGRRPAGDGRLRPLEAPRGAARRRDPNAARRRDATDPALALTGRPGAPQKSPGRLIRNAQPPLRLEAAHDRLLRNPLRLPVEPRGLGGHGHAGRDGGRARDRQPDLHLDPDQQAAGRAPRRRRAGSGSARR